MENEKNVVEALDETKDEIVVTDENEKIGIVDRVTGSKPVQAVKRHWKGFVAGAATVAAVGTAAVLAGKAAAEGAIETPLDLGEIKDAVADTVES